MAYERLIESTLFENWFELCSALTFGASIWMLSRQDTLAMASVYPRLREVFQLPGTVPFSGDFTDWLSDETSRMRSRAFLRTGIGMIKENALGYAPVTRSEDAIGILRHPDSRQAKYLRNRLQDDDEASVVLRPFLPVETSNEIRLFVSDGELVGACPCYPSKKKVWPDDLPGRIVAFFDQLRPCLPVPSVVADIVVGVQGLSDSIMLIELNPFIPSTDPLQFSWNGYDFDGTLRL